MGNTVFADVIKLGDHQRGALIQQDPRPCTKREVQTQAYPGRRLGEHGGEIQARHLEAKELLGLQKLEEEEKSLPWRLRRVRDSADTAIWDIQPPHL